MTIATDIICGFPTETEDNFEETMTLCEKYKFPSLFINQFFPRPGTPAALMARIDPQVVKKRTKRFASLFASKFHFYMFFFFRLTDLFYSYEPYGHKVGEIQDVLVTEVN